MFANLRARLSSILDGLIRALAKPPDAAAEAARWLH